MILIYAFSNRWGTNISRRTLLEIQKLLPLDTIEYQSVYFHPKDFFQKHIRFSKYSLIIGLGDASFQGPIRIETQAKNSYLNQSIYPFSPILLDLSLPPVEFYNPDQFKLSSNMGTYNCNWLAYSTQLLISQNKLPSLQLFLHLPPKSNAGVLARNIVDFFEINQVLK